MEFRLLIRCFRFQFTPLREGRRGKGLDGTQQGLFQFTPLREGRPDKAASKFAPKQISIHAPPRGATARPPKERKKD